MNQFNRSRAALLIGTATVLLAALGCTKSADLGDSSRATLSDGPAPGTTGGNPWKLVDDEEQIGDYLVYGGQLFWTTGRFDSLTSTLQHATLQSCNIQQCASSHRALTLLDRSHADTCDGCGFGTELHSDGEYLYFEGIDVTRGSTRYAPGTIFPSLLRSINLEDFSQAGPNPLSHHSAPPYVILGQDLYYWTPEGQLFQCIAKRCDDTLQQLLLTLPTGSSPVPLSTSLFDENGYLYLQDSTRLMRTKNEANASLEILYDSGHTDEVGPLVVSGGHLFFTEGFSNAPRFLRTCPASGCGSQPTTLTQGIGILSEITAHGDDVYVLESVLTRGPAPGTDVTVLEGGDKITRVSATGAYEPQVIAEKIGVLHNPTVVDGFLYFIGTDLPRDVAAGIQRDSINSYGYYIGTIALPSPTEP